MNCKGVPTPLEAYAMRSAVSGIYMPITALGNLLLILTILVDPLHELRTRFNLLYMNALLGDACFGLLIDGYRVWGNRLRSIGVNLKKEYPYVTYFGQMCHVVYFSSQVICLLTLSALFVDRILHVIFNNRRSPYIVLGVVSLCIWSLGAGLSLLYYTYGFTNTELVVISISIIWSVFSLIAAYFLIYCQATNEIKQVLMQEYGTASQSEMKAIKNEMFDSPVQLNLHSQSKEGNEMEECPRDKKGERDTATESKRNQAEGKISDAKSKLQNAEKLLIACVVHFVFHIPTCVLAYVGKYGMYPSCIAEDYLGSWKMLSVASHKAFNPFIVMATIASFRRGILHLLRIKRLGRVAPKFNR